MDISQHIITTNRKLVEVVAIPGSGKTRTLAMRVQHLLKTGIPASQILILSFSNESVREAKERIEKVLSSCSGTSTDSDASRVANLCVPRVMTVHSFALSLLSKHGEVTKLMGPNRAQALLVKAVKHLVKDANQQAALSIKHLGESVDHQKVLLQAMEYSEASETTLWTVVSSSRFELLHRYLQPRALLKDVKREYQCRIQRANVISYGDMLRLAAKALESDPLSDTLRHVLVDEYQDCSAAQTRLLIALARAGAHVMTFGDPCQAIYGFGGNQYTPLSDVLEGVKQMGLSTSHRLTRQTAALAAAVIGVDTDAIATNQNGPMPVLCHHGNVTTQTAAIAQEIRDLIEGDIPAREIVVLARTRALLVPVEQHLLALGVDTYRLGRQLDRGHVSRVLRLVRCVERAVRSGCAITSAGIKKALRPVTTDDYESFLPAAEMAKRLPSVEGKYRACSKIYLRVLGGVRVEANKDARYALTRWEPMCRFRQSARDVLVELRALTNDTVVTSTFHAAKGKEWRHVFIVGMSDGQVPIHFAKDGVTLAEERRLLYVAITRAKVRVRLYHSPTMDASGSPHFSKLSRFLTNKVRKSLLLE